MLNVFNLKIENSDIGETTIGGYLIRLLADLWKEGEGFSGKRPFGNSGWEYDLYTPLIKEGLVKGRLDEDGFIEEVDRKAADLLILSLINNLTVAE